MFAKPFDRRWRHAKQLQLVSGGTRFGHRNLIFTLPALQLGGSDHISLEEGFGPLGIAPVQLQYSPRLQVGQLLGGEFATVQARQHVAFLHGLAQHGINLGDPAGNRCANAGQALLVKVDTAGHPQSFCHRLAGHSRQLELCQQLFSRHDQRGISGRRGKFLAVFLVTSGEHCCGQQDK